MNTPSKPTSIGDVIRAAHSPAQPESKAGARHSAEDLANLKKIADHASGIADALKSLGLDNNANADNAGNADTGGKGSPVTKAAPLTVTLRALRTR